MSPLLAYHCLPPQVLAAEFPEWEAVASFCVFDIEQHCDGDRLPSTAETVAPALAKPLARLASCFGVDAEALLAQWLDFMPLAMQHFKQDAKGNLVAWQAALATVQQRRAETRAKHPREVLSIVLAAYATINGSDSSLERLFSQADHRISPQARHCANDTENRKVTLLTVPLETMYELMPKVNEVWDRHFVVARAGNFNRLDSGRQHRYGKRTAADARPNEAAFLKHRRMAVSALKEGRVPRRVSELVDVDILSAWTPGHDAELDFNRRKRHARRIEAYHAKSLLPDEVDEDLVREALANKDTLTKARRSRANQEARQSLHFQGRRLAPVEFTGQAIHIPDNIRTALLDRWVASLGLNLITVASAVLVLMPPIADPASELLWGAMLAGAWVMAPAWLEDSDAYTGPMLKFRPAVHSRRYVWLSPNFKASHVQVARVIEECAARRDSRWSLREDVQEWVKKKNEVMQLRSSSSTIALVTATEKEAFEGVAHVFDLAAGFAFLCCLDRQQSSFSCLAQRGCS